LRIPTLKIDATAMTGSGGLWFDHSNLLPCTSFFAEPSAQYLVRSGGQGVTNKCQGSTTMRVIPGFDVSPSGSSTACSRGVRDVWLFVENKAGREESDCRSMVGGALLGAADSPLDD
jgi:hypothetical protein